MEPVNEYLWIMIAMVLSIIISLFVFFKTKSRWIGCLTILFTCIVLFMASGFLFAMCRGYVDSSNESEAMVGIRLIEEDRDCRFETKWWMKTDNTYYYEFEKESNHHKVEPCGNDSYSDKGTFTRIDSIYAIKANIKPNLVIYFDLDDQKVTPIYNNDTIEVISTNWNLIKEYFKQAKQNK